MLLTVPSPAVHRSVGLRRFSLKLLIRTHWLPQNLNLVVVLAFQAISAPNLELETGANDSSHLVLSSIVLWSKLVPMPVLKLQVVLIEHELDLAHLFCTAFSETGR